MFLNLIKKYLIVFVYAFVGYSFLNWLVSTRLNININEKYLDVWMPVVLCIAVTYFIFRPVVKQLKYSEKSKDFLLWFIIPFTIWFPIIFSQKYFKDISYKIISINKPSDLYNFPREKFFKIKSFSVISDDYFIMRERHASGKNGTTLNVLNYYIAPVYDDNSKNTTDKFSTIGYGVQFSTSMHNGFFDEKLQEPIIKNFNKKSAEDYNKYEFYKVDYFEKIKNSDNAEYFLKAIQHHNNFDKSADCLVVVNRSGTLGDLFDREKKIFLYSTFISLGIGLLTMFLVNVFSGKKIND